MTSPSVPVLAPRQAPEAGGYAKGDRETGETGLSGLTEPTVLRPDRTEISKKWARSVKAKVFKKFNS